MTNIIPLTIKPYVPRIVTGREPASIIILPVVRIKRTPDDAPMSPGQRLRKLRRQTSRDICDND